VRNHRPGTLLVSALLLASLARGAPGAAPTLTGKLVYAANGGGSFNLWATNADGSGARQITHTPQVHELDPEWSPDGTRIAFARRPNSRGGWDISVMNEDGSGLRHLTNELEGPIDRDPTWSPDGDRLAWARTIPGQGRSELWTMGADGTGKRPLVRPDPGKYAGSPEWSPDGSRVAFVGNMAGGFPDVWTVRTDGTGLRQVTSTPQMEGNPTWSPDGEAIGFERRTVTGTSQIWAAGPTGEDLRRLTSGPGVKEQPTWAPAGSAIAYVRSPEHGGGKDLEAASVDGTAGVALTATAGAEVAPDWAEGSVAGREPGPNPAFSMPAEGTSVGSSFASSGQNVGPGLRLVKGRFQQSDFWALEFNPEKASTLDVALATDVLPGRETVSSMAKRHGAIAAINGDFPHPSGAPIHPLAEDGDLKRTALHVSHNFAPSMDEETMYLDRPIDSISVTEADGGDRWPIDRWNDGDPTFGEVAGYTAAGSTDATPPSFACSARLALPGPMRMAPGAAGIEREYTVDAVACRGQPLGRAGGVVLAARPGTEGAVMIASLTVGERVSVGWWFHGWASVADSIGGWPPLLHEGETLVHACSQSICRRHPRAGVGITGTGTVLLVVVDGRREGSLGLTLVQLVSLFRHMDAMSALNLDGGGTAEMWLRGRVLNHPSDGRERPTASAILVLPDEDAGQTILPAGKLAPGEEAAAARDAVLDPASTGGLLDGMTRGLFGPRRALPAELRDELRTFRSRGQSGNP
jgi:hypothetical protein